MKVHSHETAAELRRLAHLQGSGRVAVRMLGVASAMENKSAPEIARESGVSRRSVQDWVRRYNHGGSERLQEQGGRGHKPVLTPSEVMLFKARLDAGAIEADGVCVLRGLDVKRILEHEFGKIRSLSSVYDLLHTIGYNDLMPRPQHIEADPVAQEAFKKKTPADIAAIAAQHPGKKIEIWFEDEARFGQQGTVTRVWAPVGSRPRAVKQTQYGNLYVLAAVCPQTGNSAGLLAPKLNTNTVNSFFEQLSLEIAPDVHVIMIWDQAGYHTSGLLKPPANVTLLSLPPKSPELNPIENLWHYLRSHHWSNRAYEDYNALEIAARDAWQKTCLNPELMKTVCAAPWLEPRS